MFNPDQLEAASASAWKKLQDSLHQLEAKSTDSLQDILTPAFYYQMNELYVSTIKPSLEMLKTLLLADTSSILYLSSLQPMFDTIFLIVSVFVIIWIVYQWKTKRLHWNNYLFQGISNLSKLPILEKSPLFLFFSPQNLLLG